MYYKGYILGSPVHFKLMVSFNMNDNYLFTISSILKMERGIIIANTKIRNNSNIQISKIAIILISSLLLFDGSLSKVITFPTIAIAKILPLLFANAFKSVKDHNYCCRNSWKSDNYMGSNTEKKP